MAEAEFTARTIIVTGAGGGLGRACAIALAAAGADLVLTDLSEAELDATAALCPRACRFPADLTDSETAPALAAFAQQSFARPVFGLVAAAGRFGPMKRLIDLTDAEYDGLFAVNTRAVWRLCKAVIAQMEQGGRGSVVLFSSTGGLEASPQAPLYSLTKGAVAMLARNLAVNHAADNIRVNCVCPGAIEGPMIEARIAAAGDARAQAESRRAIVAAHPMGRIGRPGEVAAAVRYLLSDAAGFTTGAMLPVDGGRLA